MLHWAFFAASVVANAVLAFLAFAPRIITFAEIVPNAVVCANCNTPEIQAALLAATDVGRDQVLGVVAPFWLLAFLAIGASFASLLAMTNARRKHQQ